MGERIKGLNFRFQCTRFESALQRMCVSVQFSALQLFFRNRRTSRITTASEKSSPNSNFSFGSQDSNLSLISLGLLHLDSS